MHLICNRIKKIYNNLKSTLNYSESAVDQTDVMIDDHSCQTSKSPKGIMPKLTPPPGSDDPAPNHASQSLLSMWSDVRNVFKSLYVDFSRVPTDRGVFVFVYMFIYACITYF